MGRFCPRSGSYSNEGPRTGHSPPHQNTGRALRPRHESHPRRTRSHAAVDARPLHTSTALSLEEFRGPHVRRRPSSISNSYLCADQPMAESGPHMAAPNDAQCSDGLLIQPLCRCTVRLASALRRSLACGLLAHRQLFLGYSDFGDKTQVTHGICGLCFDNSLVVLDEPADSSTKLGWAVEFAYTAAHSDVRHDVEHRQTRPHSRPPALQAVAEELFSPSE